MDKVSDEWFRPPISVGPDDMIPSVAALAAGLGPGGRFKSSTFRRHLMTASGTMSAATDLSHLPPYGDADDADTAWAERFAPHPMVIKRLLEDWTASGAVLVEDSGRNTLYRMHSTRGMGRFLRNVIRCEEGLQALRMDLLLLSLCLPRVYSFDAIVRVHPRLKSLYGHVGPDPRVPLATAWDARWILGRIEGLLLARRDQLFARMHGVERLRQSIAPALADGQSVPDALQHARGLVPADQPTVYPSVFAWKRRSGPDTGLDRLAALYRTLPDEVARADFEGGMRVRAEVLYGGMAGGIEDMVGRLRGVVKR